MVDSPDPENVAGELLVRGANVMLGYYKNPEETEMALRDGWLHTGDICNVDSDGFIYIRGRNKNMILGPSGEHISRGNRAETQQPAIRQRVDCD